MSSQFPEEVLLPLPAPLKSLLEDDCFWILRRDKLVRLPVPNELNVETILREFYMSCLDGSSEDNNLQLLSEVLDGIKVYFDFTLADHLLYGPEKEQHRQLGILNPIIYSTATSQHTSLNDTNCDGSERGGVCLGSLPSQVYGAIHLLRLFVKMPHFISCAQFSVNHVHILHIYLRDFIGYICSRKQDLFSEDHYSETTHPINNSHECNNLTPKHTLLQRDIT